MNVESKLARLMRNTGPARFLVPVGIILIVFGCILLGFRTDTYEETVGKITAVTEGTYDTEQKQQQYDVSVSYTVGGKAYETVFANLTGSFKVGEDIKVYYDPEDPSKTTNSKLGGFLAPVLIVLGAAAAGFGIFRTVKAFQKSKELDQTTPGKGAPAVDFQAFKSAPGVTEYYSRHDGNSLKPGYVIEDADRVVLFEAKMLKNNPLGARTFELTDHTSGVTKEHEVGHVTTQSYNDEVFSARSGFKFDGKNIWDLLHERGLRLTTDLHSKFPYLIYDVSRGGEAFARIESSSVYVHEDEEAQHKLVVPYGRYYYRIWTDSDDLELIFLTVFAVSESEQAVVE